MSGAANLKVVSTGVAVEGFDDQSVAAEFASLFGVSAEKATSFMGSERVIKKNLTAGQAEEYRAQLTAIGMTVTVQEDAANESPFSLVPEEKASPPVVEQGRAAPEADGLSVEPVAEIEGAAGMESNRSERGMGSGALPSASSTRTGTGTARTAASRVESVVDDDDEDALTSKAIVFAAVGALIGAIVWKVIAMTTGYELGVVAWGLGGLVGFAAAVGGGRGQAMGITCGVLALLAIFGGKFLAIDSMQDDFAEAFGLEQGAISSDMQAEDVMREIFLDSYNEEMTDANGYVRLSGTTRSIKQFMIDHSFFYADSITEISDADVAEFRASHDGWLRDYAARQLSFEQWIDENVGQENANEYVELLTGPSAGKTASMVIDSLSPIDFLFIFLGVSTAFSLGRAGRKDD